MQKLMVLASVVTVVHLVGSNFVEARGISSWPSPLPGFVVRRVELDGDGLKNDEIEGAIWEYKIVLGNTKKNAEPSRVVRGKLRIKGNAIYGVQDRPQVAEQEHRIGDVVKPEYSDELQLRFDDHRELKGTAFLKSRKEGGVFVGYFRDKHKQRWKFELRRGED